MPPHLRGSGATRGYICLQKAEEPLTRAGCAPENAAMPGVGSAAQGHILLLVPRQRRKEVLRLKIGPQPVHHIEICIDGLDRQKTGQTAHPAPADHQLHPGDIVGTKLAADLVPACARRMQLGQVPTRSLREN